MANLADYRRDGRLQRLSFDNGQARAVRAPLDPETAPWSELDAWRRINAQVRQWQAAVDAYARALPISRRDEPAPKYLQSEGGQVLNPEWAAWDAARRTVAEASAETVALHEARIGVPDTVTGPDGEPREVVPERAMVLDWPDAAPGPGQVYALTAEVAERVARIGLTVVDGDAARLAAEAEALRPAALAAIDARAEAVRLGYLTAGDGQALEYEATRREARAADAAADPLDPADWPMLAAERQARIAAGADPEPSLRDIVARVLDEAARWAAVGAAIKRVRRTGKARVKAAREPAALRAARDEALAGLEALRRT